MTLPVYFIILRIPCIYVCGFFTGYIHTVLPLYNLDDFRYHYRVTRGAYEILLTTISPVLDIQQARGDRYDTSPETQLLVFLWYMATQQSMREIGHQFNLAKATVHKIVHNVSDVFWRHLSHVRTVFPVSIVVGYMCNNTY